MEKIVNTQKAPKDIILNQILQEVDEENDVVENKINQKSINKRSWLKKFFYFSLVILLMCIFLVIYFINHAIKDEDLKTVKASTTLPTHTTAPKKKIKEPMISISDMPSITIDSAKPMVRIQNKVTNKVEEVMEIVIPLSSKEQEVLARKKAKAKLLNEMKN
jgi:hypothetical protein